MSARHTSLLTTSLCVMYCVANPVSADQPAGAAIASELNPRYLLVDASGHMVSNEDFPGRFQLITFGYTFCPDVCPTTLASMAQLRRELGGSAKRLQLIFITVDPQRDTPEVLRRYTSAFSGDVIGLTGKPEFVRAAAEHFKVTYRKYNVPGEPAGSYGIDHTAGMFLLGPDGSFVQRFPQIAASPVIAARIRALVLAAPRS